MYRYTSPSPSQSIHAREAVEELRRFILQGVASLQYHSQLNFIRNYHLNSQSSIRFTHHRQSVLFARRKRVRIHMILDKRDDQRNTYMSTMRTPHDLGWYTLQRKRWRQVVGMKENVIISSRNENLLEAE